MGEGERSMKVRKATRSISYLFVLLALSPALLTAQPRFRFFGSNELTIENYEVDGATSESPFRFEGTFFTNRLNLNLESDDGRGRKVLLRAELLGADNDYLRHDGLLLARFAVELEDGGRSIPYRLAAGDLFAGLSQRVLNRGVRGVSVELQPELGRGAHSLLFVSGSGEPDWRSLRRSDDLYFNGISYLYTSPAGRTSVVANLVDSRQRAGVSGAFPISATDLEQTIGSVYAESSMGPVRLEAELSALDGSRGGEGFDDTSFYAMLSRSDGWLSWRVRFEEVGDLYAPIGVSFLSGRRSIEADGRLLGRAGTLRARMQRLDSALFLQTGRPLRTDFASLAWDLPMLARRPNLRVSLMADRNDLESRDGLTDLLYTHVGLEVIERIGQRIEVGYRGHLRDTEDRRRDDRRLWDHDLSIGRQFDWTAGTTAVRGDLRGGIIWRNQERSAAYESWSPIVEGGLRSGAHALRLYLAFLRQEFETLAIGDLRYDTRRLTYSWMKRPHTLFAEVADETRDQQGRPQTASTRLSLRYRLEFGR
jgi:hypothetical protein